MRPSKEEPKTALVSRDELEYRACQNCSHYLAPHRGVSREVRGYCSLAEEFYTVKNKPRFAELDGKTRTIGRTRNTEAFLRSVDVARKAIVFLNSSKLQRGYPSSCPQGGVFDRKIGKLRITAESIIRRFEDRFGTPPTNI